MRCLWCFCSRFVHRSSKGRRNDAPYRLQESHRNPGSISLSTHSGCTTQSVSRTVPQIPPRQRARATFDMPCTSSTLPSSLGSPVVCTVPTEQPSTLTPASEQSPTTHSSYDPHSSIRSHDSGIARSQVRHQGPQGREDSPTLPRNWSTSGMTFNKRMFQRSKQNSAASGTSVQHQTFLDDTSTSCSDSEDRVLNCNLDAKGLDSRHITPATQTETFSKVNRAAIRPDFIPAPLFFHNQTATPPARTDLPRTPESRNSTRLCDHRPCLRQNGTCLEHTPTLRLKRSHHTARRNTRGNESRRYEPDIWMKIASEYQVCS